MAEKKRPKRARPKKKAPAFRIADVPEPDEKDAYDRAPSLLGSGGRVDPDARPDEPPPSLVPPDVQRELDRLKRENNALRGALHALLALLAEEW